MVYQGSKRRIKKYILPIMLKDRKPNQYFVEPFVGGGNSIEDVPNPRMANDIDKYLIALYKALLDGRKFEVGCTKEFYDEQKKIYRSNTDECDMALVGWIGATCSFGGKSYNGGYCKPAYSKDASGRNRHDEVARNAMKQLPKLQGIEFYSSDYKDLEIPNNSIIYCDIPYKGTTKYSKGKGFNYEEFYDWCRLKHEQGHKIYVSEYDMPDDFVQVWEKETITTLGDDNAKPAIERLFTLV